MAITQALCNSFKKEILDGTHGSGDTYKIALFTSAAALDKNTATYSSTNEVANGGGYTTGGATLAGRTSALSGDTAYLDFTDPQWTTASITARGAVIYNSSQGNKAVAVIDFGADYTSTNGTFTVVLPAPGATAIVRVT